MHGGSSLTQTQKLLSQNTPAAQTTDDDCKQPTFDINSMFCLATNGTTFKQYSQSSKD